MDFTKFIKDKNKFTLIVNNSYIKESIEVLKDIRKAEFILLNNHRFNYKIEIDEYFAYFLKEKNNFIQSFQQNIIALKNDPQTPEDRITLFKEILSILKSKLDALITNFKIIKQNIYKKAKQQERFNEQKFNFFSEKEEDNIGKDTLNKNISNINSNNNINKTKKNSKPKTIIKNILDDFDSFKKDIKNKYKETNNVIEMLMDKEKQNYEKTKKILFDLSSLVTTVQKKMYEQGEMTKNILFNSLKSIDNIEEGNKHLTKAKEYQKGRGFMIGLIFIILGLFLILADR